jgi:hypothetical protein
MNSTQLDATHAGAAHPALIVRDSGNVGTSVCVVFNVLLSSRLQKKNA